MMPILVKIDDVRSRKKGQSSSRPVTADTGVNGLKSATDGERVNYGGKMCNIQMQL